MSFASSPASVTLIPTPRTPLIGRANEVATGCTLLVDDSVPLLTLTGPGGVGKTRLALAIAHDVAGSFADGSVFVDLSSIRDPALVIPAIAQILDVRGSGERSVSQSLIAFLKPRQVLLLLDNFEQVLAAAPEIADLLATCPAVQVLATSRAPLHLRGEQEMPVPPLPCPAADASDAAALAKVESVALFLQRARATVPAFLPSDDDLRAIAGCCRRIDGLPLAIELAAARMKVLSPAALLARLSNRLRLLACGARDLPDRQRTLRDTIAWSHELLAPDEQALFRRLAVFAGGFDADAAATVGGVDALAVLDQLTALADQSLIRGVESAAGAARWSMLETIREFGLERLAASGDERAIRDWHLAWCIDTVEAAWPLRAAAPASGDARLLDRERDSLRAALEWTIGRGETDAALRLVGGLAEYWWQGGGIGEGRSWLEQALALPGGAPALRSAALAGVSALAWMQGDGPTARAMAEQGLALAVAHGDTFGVVRARLRLGQLALYVFGDAAEAKVSAEETIDLARQVGSSDDLGWATLLLGAALRDLGDPVRRVALFEEAIRHFAQLGDQTGELYATQHLAADCRERGRHDEAIHLYRRCADLARDMGNNVAMVEIVVHLAVVAIDRGDHVAAARLLGLADGMGEPLGLALGSVHQLYQRAASAARDRLGADAFAVASEAGHILASDLSAVDALAFAVASVAGSMPAEIVTRRAAAVAGESTPAAVALSKREREILHLLIQRYSDPEIAEQLFLSVRTVEWHVRGVFNKLGVNSRREAAVLAARHGLV